MAISRPRMPAEIDVLTTDNKMSKEWRAWLQSVAAYIPPVGSNTVTSANPLQLVTSGSKISFNNDGTITRDDTTLIFPELIGDVTSIGLTVNLKDIVGANAGLLKFSHDAKGRVISSTAVTQSDLTSLIGTNVYLPLTGGTLTGNLIGTNVTANNVIALTSVTSPLVNVDNIQFNVTPVTKLTTAGSLSWNDNDGCLDIVMKGGNVVLQVGQEQVQRMVNKSGVNVTDGQAVYVFGAQGNRVSFKLANANSEATSKATLGIVTEPIANNQEGFVTTEGLVRGLNTSAWLEGDVIYLNSIDGGLTNVQQTYPNHNVIIGYVVRSHAVNGSIYVKVTNGYELEELHNVIFTGLAANDLLKYDGSKWVNTASAAKADTLTIPRTISLSGDATGSVSFDGSANVSIATTLASIVTAGTYKSVTVNAKGLVTAGTNPTTLAGFGITDAMNNVNPSFTGTMTAASITSTGGSTFTTGSTASVTIQTGVAGFGGGLQVVGRSNSYGSTNGVYTGGINAVCGTAGNASWVWSATSAGTFRAGLQVLDAGGVVRLYEGTNFLQFASGSLLVPNNLLVNGATSQIGFTTGAGGTVTQLTSKATGVTINKSCGNIITSNSALASNAVTSFTVTNSVVGVNDVIDIHRASGGTAVSYNIWVDSVAAGSFVVAIRNINAASLSEAITLNFIVTKSVTA